MSDVYSRNVNEATTKLQNMRQDIEDLKISYNYSGIKSGQLPFLLQNQIQLLDKLKLSRDLQTPFVGKYLNYGDFVSTLQMFDQFDQFSKEGKEKASEIIEIENKIRDANAYINYARPFLMPQDQRLIPENKSLYNLATEYLLKAPEIQTFRRANMRQSIVREAFFDLSKADVARALKNHLIDPGEVETMEDAVDKTTPRGKRYSENLAFAQNTLLKGRTVKRNTLTTKVHGVTFANEDTGIGRQIILAHLEQEAKAGKPIYLALKKEEYKGEPAYAVLWGHDRNKIEQLGYLPKEQSIELDHVYHDKPINVRFLEITGGGTDKNGVSLSRGCSIELVLPEVKEPEKKPELVEKPAVMRQPKAQESPVKAPEKKNIVPDVTKDAGRELI